jgi:tryptophanyl-tRNA synthetase
VDCKKILAASLKALLDPMRVRRAEILKNPDHVRNIIEEGNRRAAAEAEKTMMAVRKALKIVP